MSDPKPDSIQQLGSLILNFGAQITHYQRADVDDSYRSGSCTPYTEWCVFLPEGVPEGQQKRFRARSLDEAVGAAWDHYFYVRPASVIRREL